MTHHPRRGLANSLASLTLISLSATAQSPTPAPTSGQQPIEEIVVEATKIERPLDHVPSAASVVGEDDIQFARQQLGLDEALNRVPGMFMQNRYNFAQDLRISIRGFGARAQFGIRGIKVLVDGIPETLPDGQGAVDSLDLGAMKEVEVLRGPSSSIYGNASGGVISVTSEGGTKEPYAELRYEGGEFDFEKYQLKTGGQTDKFNYLVSVSGQSLDGYRQQSQAEDKLLTGRFDIDLGNDRDLLAVINYTDQPVSNDPGGVTLAQLNANPRAAFPANVLFHAGEALDQTRVGFVYTAPLGENGSFRARNYYAWRDFGNLLPVQAGGIVNIDRTFGGAGFDYHYDGYWLDRPNHLVVGMDFDDQDDYRTRYANVFGVQGAKSFDQREHVEAAGVFVQDELSLSKKTRLTMSVRTDRVNFDVTDHFLADGNDSGELTFDHTSPMVGVNVDLSPSTVLYATYSTSFETPTTTELNKPDTSGGFNPNLKPMIATNYEVGVRGKVAATNRYEVAVFTIDVQDELIPFEVPGAPGRNYYQNAGKSKRNGVELSWTMNPTDALRATFSYTYSDFTFSRFIDSAGNNYAGKVIPGTSENVLFAEIEYRNAHGWFAALDATYNDGQYGDNANTTKVAGYTIANLRLGYETDSGNMHFSPFVGIYNVFDETYSENVRLNPVGGRYYEAGPWRNAYAGITARWRF
jgi:iron complex outermembrane receptor protein